MTTGIRKLVLTAHVTASVGWLGAVLTYLVLATAAVISKDPQLTSASPIALELVGWYVIAPLSIASVATGLVQSLATEWGIFRHYWVATKFVLSVFAMTILFIHLGTTDQTTPMVQHVVHAAGGLVVLLIATSLSVYKPQGMTPYGLRKRGERATVTAGTVAASSELALGRSLPWGKVIGVHLAVLAVLAFVLLHLAGGMHH